MQLSELTERLIALEQRLTSLERLVKTAVGFDENCAEHSEQIAAIIAEQPGHSQRGIIILAKQRFDLSRNRVIELLRAGVGRYWTLRFGISNSLLYHPITDSACAEVEQTRANNAQVDTNYAEASR